MVLKIMMTSSILVPSILLVTWCCGVKSEASCPPVTGYLGRSRLLQPVNGRAPIGTGIRFSCIEDATMDRETRYRRMAMCVFPGKWDKEPPICHKKCPVMNLKHGKLSSRFGSVTEQTNHNHEVTLECDTTGKEEYVLEFPNYSTLVCRNGTWSVWDGQNKFKPAGAPRCLPKNPSPQATISLTPPSPTAGVQTTQPPSTTPPSRNCMMSFTDRHPEKLRHLSIMRLVDRKEGCMEDCVNDASCVWVLLEQTTSHYDSVTYCQMFAGDGEFELKLAENQELFVKRCFP